MLDWISHVKTNALWKNVDYASSSGNNLNTILVEKKVTVVLERNIVLNCVFQNKILLFKQ